MSVNIPPTVEALLDEIDPAGRLLLFFKYLYVCVPATIALKLSKSARSPGGIGHRHLMPKPLWTALDKPKLPRSCLSSSPLCIARSLQGASD
jgi:hypothetical protein